jgi:hypothetical protein
MHDTESMGESAFIESGNLRRAVWETALRLANGGDHRALAGFIRLHVRALQAAQEARQQ